MVKMSPLTQGRGLKQYMQSQRPTMWGSPLTQGRGLKHYMFNLFSIKDWSPLTQGRGLKLLRALLEI